VDYHLDNQVTGIDILTYLESEFGVKVPSIVVTADHSEKIRQKVVEKGHRLLNKPLQPHRLRAWMTHSIEADKQVS